jgi:hypothetical protein
MTERPLGADDLQLDTLTLEQALVDVEIANERVRDLTFRLLASTRAIAELRESLRAAEHRVAELEREREEIRNTRAYKLARRIWMLRDAVRS